MQFDTETMTEAEARTVFHAIRSRFGWSGTVFVREDVESAVREELENELDDDAEVDEERVKTLTDQVMDDYAYIKLDDRLAEVGNEVIYDAARDAVNGTLVW